MKNIIKYPKAFARLFNEDLAVSNTNQRIHDSTNMKLTFTRLNQLD